MKHKKYLLILIILIFTFSFAFLYMLNRGFGEIDWWLFIFLLPLIFILLPAFLLALIIRPFIKQKNIYKLLVWTCSIGLGVVLYFNLRMIYYKIYPDYSAMHRDLNNLYRNQYGDERDNLVGLAIAALDTNRQIKGYGINSLDVLERDTIINGNAFKYYNVGIIYYLGREINSKNAFACRYLVYSDKSVQELYNKPLSDTLTTLKDMEEYNNAVDISRPYVDSFLKTIQ